MTKGYDIGTDNEPDGPTIESVARFLVACRKELGDVDIVEAFIVAMSTDGTRARVILTFPRRKPRKMDPVCRIHDPDDAVPGRICGRPVPCREHG